MPLWLPAYQVKWQQLAWQVDWAIDLNAWRTAKVYQQFVGNESFKRFVGDRVFAITSP